MWARFGRPHPEHFTIEVTSFRPLPASCLCLFFIWDVFFFGTARSIDPHIPWSKDGNVAMGVFGKFVASRWEDTLFQVEIKSNCGANRLDSCELRYEKDAIAPRPKVVLTLTTIAVEKERFLQKKKRDGPSGAQWFLAKKSRRDRSPACTFPKKERPIS